MRIFSANILRVIVGTRTYHLWTWRGGGGVVSILATFPKCLSIYSCLTQMPILSNNNVFPFITGIQSWLLLHEPGSYEAVADLCFSWQRKWITKSDWHFSLCNLFLSSMSRSWQHAVERMSVVASASLHVTTATRRTLYLNTLRFHIKHIWT